MHTALHRQKLLARVRRIRGQVDAIERALESGGDCDEVMHQIAGVRGAEVVQDHVLSHLVDAEAYPPL